MVPDDGDGRARPLPSGVRGLPTSLWPSHAKVPQPLLLMRSVASSGEMSRHRGLGTRFDFGTVLVAVHVSDARQSKQLGHLGPLRMERRDQLVHRSFQFGLSDRTRESGEDPSR